MKIIYSNEINDLKDLIIDKAKYQKVMLVYDHTISNIEISDLYRLIREECIFNKTDISNLDINEINNGYKLLIFKCSTDSFLSIQVDLEDFDNIFIPTDKAVLPYYLNYENKKSAKDSFLVQSDIDIHMNSSISFNQFLHYLKSFFINFSYNIDFTIDFDIDILSPEMKFEDIEILKKTGIEYKYLSLIDLLLIDAFLVMITAIRTNNLSMIDIYKDCKDDETLIDKLYARVSDNALINIVRLNYTQIYKTCLMAKSNILSSINTQYFTAEDIGNILDRLKFYAKYDDALINYLYIFGILDKAD